MVKSAVTPYGSRRAARISIRIAWTAIGSVMASAVLAGATSGVAPAASAGQVDEKGLSQAVGLEAHVAPSNGSNAFGGAALRHGDFAPSTNLPGTGDVDRDGDDDLIGL